MWPVSVIIIAILLFIVWFLNWIDGNSSQDEAYTLLLVFTHIAALIAGILFCLAAIKIAFGSIAAYAQHDAQTDRYRHQTYKAVAAVDREHEKQNTIHVRQGYDQWKVDQRNQPKQLPMTDKEWVMLNDNDDDEFIWQD